MSKFDPIFEPMLENQRPISNEARHSMDQAYAAILNGKVRKKRNFHQKAILRSVTIAAMALVIVAVSLNFSTISEAFGSFFRFDQFTSAKLKKTGFVKTPDVSDTDQEIKITVNEVYTDQKQMGIHLTISLPEKSKLADEKYNLYSINFAVLDKSDVIQMDFNSGLEGERAAFNQRDSYTADAYFDAKNNRIEMVYTYDFGNDKPENTDLNKIVVSKITASNEGSDEPGYHKLKEGTDYDVVEGKWSVALGDIKVDKFTGIKYFPDEQWKGDMYGEATPTTFSMKIKKATADQDSNFARIQSVSVLQDGVEQSYSARMHDTEFVDGEEYYRTTFDYQGYDTADVITYHVGELSFELIKSE